MELKTVVWNVDTGMYHCQECEKGFKQKSNAKSHYENVHKNVKHKCKTCGKEVRKLKAHIREVHGEKKLVNCEICFKLYPEGRLISDHMLRTHSVDLKMNPIERVVVTCDICNREVLERSLERHRRINHYTPENYRAKCPLCNSHVKSLSWHMRKYHRKTDAAKCLQKCFRCGLLHLSKHELKTHLLEHEDYHCTTCQLRFETYIQLAKHMHTIHGKISQCGTKFEKIPDTTPMELSPVIATKYFVKEGEIIKPTQYDFEESVQKEVKTTFYLDARKLSSKTENDDNNIPNVMDSGCTDINLFDIIVPPRNGNADDFHISVDIADPDNPEPQPPVSTQLPCLFSRPGDLVPRHLRDRSLGPGEEQLLQSVPPPGLLSHTDLAKFRIGERRTGVHSRSGGDKKKDKYIECPSRQIHLCPYCRQILKSKDSLRRHIEVLHHNNKRFLCLICDKIFSTNADLKKHHKVNHENTGPNMVECEECHEQVKKTSLNRHRSYRHCKNNLSKICDCCGRDFKTREIMLKHKRIIHNHNKNENKLRGEKINFI